MSILLSLLLAAQILFDPNDPNACENFAPNHSSGIYITTKKIRPSELEGLYRNIVTPALSIDWANTPYQKAIVKEFLRVTYGRDRRLHLYVKPTRKDLLAVADSLTAVMLPTGQFLNQQCTFPDDYKPWEAALCVRKQDHLDDYSLGALVSEAANGWPWLTCRNKAPDGKMPTKAGADLISIDGFDIEPEVFSQQKYWGLEYLVTNVGHNVGTSTLLNRYKRFWYYGAGSLEVWYAGGKVSRYKRIIEKLDKWGSSPLPDECKKIPFPAPIAPPFPPPGCVE